MKLFFKTKTSQNSVIPPHFLGFFLLQVKIWRAHTTAFAKIRDLIILQKKKRRVSNIGVK